MVGEDGSERRWERSDCLGVVLLVNTYRHRQVAQATIRFMSHVVDWLNRRAPTISVGIKMDTDPVCRS